MKYPHEYTIFDLTTRRPVSCITCNPKALAQHVKDGQIAIPGRHRSMLLNDANEPEHDAARAGATDRERLRTARLVQIQELELKQLRRVLEVLAESDPRIKTAVDEIAKLRTELK